MRVCLIPLCIEARKPSTNIQRFRQRLEEATPYAPDLICLPECAFTGYLYESHDLERYAEPIPGDTTTTIAELAGAFRCSICFGMPEHTPESWYSSGVLIDPSSRIALVQRKMSEQIPFMAGDHIRVLSTEFGRLAILLCGDLFEEEARRQAARAEIVIVPLTRSFDGPSPDQERWMREERQAYADAVRSLGTTALIVNVLEDPELPEASFGGALVIDPNGNVLAESPHGTDEALIFDI